MPGNATEFLKGVERLTQEQQRDETFPDLDASADFAAEGLDKTSRGSSPKFSPDTGLDELHESSPSIRDHFQTLPFTTAPFHSQLVVLADKDEPATEAFRLLGVRLRHLRRDSSFKRLLITSTVTEEGKSLISANLACTLAAASQQRVLLIDGDVRRSAASDLFGAAPNPGLCEYLRGERNLVDCAYYLTEANLWLMPTGVNPANPIELLLTPMLSTMMDKLDRLFDWIIIDSPPVLPLADTSIWTRVADRILLVARRGVTEKRKLIRGIETLDPRKLLGTVLNSSTNSTNDDYYYYQRPSDSGNPLTSD
jgi:capsular exopolysaccharide synthesis family protein